MMMMMMMMICATDAAAAHVLMGLAVSMTCIYAKASLAERWMLKHEYVRIVYIFLFLRVWLSGSAMHRVYVRTNAEL